MIYGFNDDLVDYCDQQYRSINYGPDRSFDMMNKYFEGRYYCIEISYEGLHWPNGRRFDSMCNCGRPFGRELPEPSKRDQIKYCEKVRITVEMDMQVEKTPTDVLEKAIKSVYDIRTIDAICDVLQITGKPKVNRG